MFFLISCFDNRESTDFYHDTIMDGDVYRIPIIEPFELATSDTSSFWSFIFLSKVENRFASKLQTVSSVDSITYKDSLIMIFNGYGNVFNFGVIDLKQQKVIEFKNRVEFNKFRSEDSLLHKLYSVKDLFRAYKKNSYLPWQNEVNAAKPINSK